MSESHHLGKQTTSSKQKAKAVVRRALSDLRLVGRSEISKRGAKQRSEKERDGRANRPIAWTIPLAMHWNLAREHILVTEQSKGACISD